MRLFVFSIILCLLCHGINAQEKDSVSNKWDSTLLIQKIGENNDREFIDETNFVDNDENWLKTRLKQKPDYKRWRLGLNGGVAYRINLAPVGIPEEIVDYKDNLRFGASLGTDLVYFASQNIGVGFKYSLFSTQHKIDNISYKAKDDVVYEGSRSDNVKLHFVGPSISVRSIPRPNKLYASCDFTIGYIMYNNNIAFANNSYKLKGDNIGFETSVGTDFMFSKKFSMGLALNISAASIKEITISEAAKMRLSENEVENFSRVNLVFVIRNYR